MLTHKIKSGHKISRKRNAKGLNSAENVAEEKVSREKKTILFFFSLNKKVSTADKNKANDGGQDDNEEEDRSAAEDCRVEERTDDLTDWIKCHSYQRLEAYLLH